MKEKKQKKLFEFKKELAEQGIFFCFNGYVSQNLLRDLLHNLNKKRELANVSRSTSNKIFKVIIEQLQNIIHYSTESTSNGDLEEISEDAAIITIGFDNQFYFISCGNKIENRHVSYIKDKLTKLQKMNKEEIRAYYIKKRNDSNQLADSKGAGLGFIELAKKSTKALEFDFQKLDDNFSYFSITSYI